MSVKRVFVWRCDACGATEARDKYGLPAGWAWTQRLLEPVRHRCAACNGAAPGAGEQPLPGGAKH